MIISVYVALPNNIVVIKSISYGNIWRADLLEQQPTTRIDE